MNSNSKTFIDAYYHLLLQEVEVTQDSKKRKIIKQVGAPIESHPQPQEPEFDGGASVEGDGGAACCGEQKQVNEQDITPKDAFFSKLYDLIDRAYALGHQAAEEGTEYKPLDDDQVNDILASLEMSFDDSKQVEIEQLETEEAETEEQNKQQKKRFHVIGKYKPSKQKNFGMKFQAVIEAKDRDEALKIARRQYSNEVFITGANQLQG